MQNFFRKLAFASACALVAFACWALVPAAPAAQAAPKLSVTFYNVGQGDGALISYGSHHMMIDGGPSSASSMWYAVLKRRGITTLDYVVATHADTDHTGGISGALQAAKAKRAFCSVKKAEQRAFKSMKKYLKKQGVTIEVPKAGASFKLGGKVKVKVVGPVRMTGSSNDSLMLRVTYKKTSFLFTGDASMEEELQSIQAGYKLTADVLKVGHHGSKYSTSTQFLKRVNAKYAVISCGKNNSYGHPTAEVLARLKKAGAKVYRTDTCGDVTFTSNGKKLTASTQK